MTYQRPYAAEWIAQQWGAGRLLAGGFGGALVRRIVGPPRNQGGSR